MKWPRFPIKPNVNDCGYGIKSAMAQIAALTATYIFTMKVGIDMMTPTIIIGALTDKSVRTEHNYSLSNISEEQMTWIGSLIYLFPPVGSVVLSFMQNRFGHRMCMMFSNVSQLLSIVMLFFADSPEGLYASSALMGFNIGYATSFTISYCGEVCEPKLRGTLSSVSNLFYYGGFLCVTMLYAITADWKLSVLMTIVIPIANTAIVYRTADSPMWLLSKGRTNEAKNTLKKLRGDVSEEKCNAEFQDMVHYASEINLNDHQKEEPQNAATTFKDFLNRFVEPETLKPLILLMIFVFFTNLLSGIPYTPYLISVFEKFEATFHPAWATTIYMACGVAGNVLTIFLINRLGKRLLALGTMATCAVCYLSIGIVGNYLPSSSISSWIKIIMFYASTFFSSMGITPIVWVLMSELFPMKSKNIGAGVSSATYFILCFLMTKFYLDFELITGFYNTFVAFGFMGLVGFVYLYFHLPETENKTLKEISEHFKTKSTKIEIQSN